MHVKVRSKLPKERKSQLMQKGVPDVRTAENLASNNLRFAASVAEFSMLLRDDEFKGDAAYKRVIEVSRSAIGVDKEGYRSEFSRLVMLAHIIEMTELQTDLGN